MGPEATAITPSGGCNSTRNPSALRKVERLYDKLPDARVGS